MKNAQPRNAELSAPSNGVNATTTPAAISLTARQSRVLHALEGTAGWITREAVDRIAGASNGPEVIRQLRDRFDLSKHLHLVCERVQAFDRDGLPCNPGRYRLTPEGRAKLAEKGVAYLHQPQANTTAARRKTVQALAALRNLSATLEG